jgi:phospholipid/cholesterol/gamma-HCH transport system substrate-binding protein
MKHAIANHLRDFIAIVVLVLLALGTAVYILAHQAGVRFPFIDASPITLNAEFSTAQAVTPGQGQTVRVSGVKIGDISGVSLKDGRAIVTMSIDPEYKGLVHTDATALLRPKTGLKDMFVELKPGSNQAPVAKPGYTMPIANTQPDVNPDEILASLDADTRSYLQLLIGDAGQGLKGRGGDLQDLFRRFEPTHRDIAAFTSAVATRREYLRRLIHSLDVINTELAGRGPTLTQLVSSSAAVFHALGSENASISRAVGDLPGTLAQTTTTLGKVQRFAQVLGPTSENLRPAVRALNTANLAVRPFAVEARPIIHSQIRPFVRDSRPLVRALRPASQDLAASSPNLTSVFEVLNHLFNMLGYNPNPKGTKTLPAQPEGFLFWLAWLNHDASNLFNSADANGVFRPVTTAATCGTIKSEINAQPQLEFLQNLVPLVSSTGICNGVPSNGGVPLPPLPNIPGLPPIPVPVPTPLQGHTPLQHK